MRIKTEVLGAVRQAHGDSRIILPVYYLNYSRIL